MRTKEAPCPKCGGTKFSRQWRDYGPPIGERVRYMCWDCDHVDRRLPLDADPSLLQALQRIARGRLDCGLPLGREEARQIARTALTERGIDW